MPVYKRSSRRSAHYKPYGKRKRATKSSMLSTYTPRIDRSFSTSNGVFGFPSSIRTKLRYHEGLAYTSASGVVTTNIYRANSVFDPNETGTGHQPMYFDQLALVYGRYVVNSSTIKITYNPASEVAATSVWVVGVIGQSAGSISSTPDINCEQGHCRWTTINGRLGGPNSKQLQLSYTPKACLNLTPKDTDAGALVSANPDQTYKFVVWVADRQATGTTNMDVEIEIFYDVTFSDRVFNVGS